MAMAGPRAGVGVWVTVRVRTRTLPQQLLPALHVYWYLYICACTHIHHWVCVSSVLLYVPVVVFSCKLRSGCLWLPPIVVSFSSTSLSLHHSIYFPFPILSIHHVVWFPRHAIISTNLNLSEIINNSFSD